MYDQEERLCNLLNQIIYGAWVSEVEVKSNKVSIDIESIENALSLCIRSLKVLHPLMEKEEPCIVYEAYTSAKQVLSQLGELRRDNENT